MRRLFQRARTPETQPEPAQPDAAQPDADAISDEAMDDAPVEAECRTDEGVRYEVLDHETVINLAADTYDAHRRELHIQGRAFTHVSDTPSGAWIYRHDR